MKKTNFFGDFDYYAEINGSLFELEDSYMFDRKVKRYRDTYCYIGIDFMHPDRNINPCIKMNFKEGAHSIKIISHHIRPFKDVTDVLLRDDGGKIILADKLLPGEIFTYNIKIKREVPFNLYFTIASKDITHSTVRTLIETNEIDFTGSLDIKLNKSSWVVKEIDNRYLQDVREIDYDTEYKY
jgi:hypothetical protein